MENHWIELHRKKQLKWWAVEFTRNQLPLLQNRSVGISRPTRSILNNQFYGQIIGPYEINIMFHKDNSDAELSSFLKISGQGMSNMFVNFYFMQGRHKHAKKIRHYEMSDLSLKSISGGKNSTNVLFKFETECIERYVI